MPPGAGVPHRVARRGATWRAQAQARVQGCRGRQPWAPQGREQAPEALARDHVAGLASSLAGLVVLMSGEGAWAGEAPAGRNALVETGGCVVSKCQKELARCLTDEKCVENLVCINKCQGIKGEGDVDACEIRCGDLYGSEVVGAFNTCAVTEEKCVPQIANRGEYPEPRPGAAVAALSTRQLEGRWYITAGLNPLFDVFDCQEHFFAAPEEGKLVIKVNWRIPRENGLWIPRSDVQTFEQDAGAPGVLYNHNNLMLHYQDDWYILEGSQLEGAEDDWFAVYYRGRNDAWDGYGGAVVYSRQPALDKKRVADYRAAFAQAGVPAVKWDKFVVTDNTCGPEPTPRIVAPSDLDTLADDVAEAEREFVIDLRKDLVSFGRSFTAVANEAQREERALERALAKELKAAEKVVERIERQYAAKGS